MVYDPTICCWVFFSAESFFMSLSPKFSSFCCFPHYKSEITKENWFPLPHFTVECLSLLSTEDALTFHRCFHYRAHLVVIQTISWYANSKLGECPHPPVAKMGMERFVNACSVSWWLHMYSFMLQPQVFEVDRSTCYHSRTWNKNIQNTSFYDKQNYYHIKLKCQESSVLEGLRDGALQTTRVRLSSANIPLMF